MLTNGYSSLRRLVRSLQDDLANLRVAVDQVLQAGQDYLLQSRRRQSAIHRPVPRRERDAYIPHFQERLRNRDDPRREPARANCRR